MLADYYVLAIQIPAYFAAAARQGVRGYLLAGSGIISAFSDARPIDGPPSRLYYSL